MRWQEKLTQKELKHLHAQGITTLRGLRETREHQRAMKAACATVEPCFDCLSIARKLGLE